MTAARDLNATAASLLGFLHQGPASGWDLLRTARLLIGRFWSITSSQAYRELAAMERSGLILAGDSGPRERRPYELTDAGRAAFDVWLRRSPGDEQIRHPLLLAISFGRHLPAEMLAGFIAEHRHAHIARLTDYLNTLDGIDSGDPYIQATLDFGIRYEQAVLDWFNALPTTLTGNPANEQERR